MSSMERAGVVMLSSQLTRRRVFFLASVIAALWVLQPLLAGILVGAALAFLSEPLKKKLIRFFGVESHSSKAAAVSILTVLLVFVVFLLPFSAVLVGAIQQISLSLGSLATDDVKVFLDRVLDELKRFTQFLPFHVSPQQALSWLSAGAQKALSWLGQNTGQWLAELPSTIFTAAVGVVSWGYFLIEGKKLRIIALRFLLPWPAERALIRNTFSELIRSMVMANIFVSLVQALIIAVFMAFAGVPHLLLWTSAAFFLSFIPVVGTAPITLGSAFWCWTVAGEHGHAIAMLICALVAGTSDNFIRPLVTRGVDELNSFWLFLAMMGGFAQFGPAGFLLGPLALALTLSSGAALRMTLKNTGNETPRCET